MKVEEMLGMSDHEAKWAPRDAMGNILRKGDVVVVGQNIGGYIFGRVTDIKIGGIDTPQGKSPTITQVGVVMNLTSGPGLQIMQVAKVVNPISDLMINHLADKVNKTTSS